MLIRSLQKAIEYSKRLSENQPHGITFEEILPETVIESQDPILSTALSPSGKFLTIGRQNGYLDVVNVEAGKLLSQYPQPKRDDNEPVIATKFGTDDSILAFASCSGDVYLCNFQKNKSHILKGCPKHSSLLSMDLSISSSPHVVTGYKDGSIRIYDVNAAKVIKEISKSSQSEEDESIAHGMRVTAVKWIPSGYDNAFLSSGWDNVTKMWDIRLPNPLVVKFHGAKVYGEGLDVKDRLILAACWAKEDQLQVFDMAKGQRILAATSPFNCDYFYSGRIVSTLNSGGVSLKALVGGCAGVMSLIGVNQEPNGDMEVSSLATFMPELDETGKSATINCIDAKWISAKVSVVVGLNNGRCYICKIL